MKMQISKLITNSPLVTNYIHVFGFNNLYLPYTQTRGLKRKPIWLPTAKSKVFRVPPRPNIPKDELQEIQRLYNNYRTYFRSVRNYFIRTVEKNDAAFDPATLKRAEKEDFDECFKINEAWNNEIAVERNKRLELEKETQQLKIFEKLEQKNLREEKVMLEIKEKVKEIKKLAPTFITRDNIDNAIQDLLSTTNDYNKALDYEGNWLKEEPEESTKKAA